MEAIILAGGFGTRIKSISQGIPKALMSVGKYKFLDLLLDNLMEHKISKVYLSLHYNAFRFHEYIETSKYGNKLAAITEPEPLGTGGAIKYVIENSEISSPLLVINGDTLSYTNLNHLEAIYNRLNYDAIIGLSYVKNALRYGKVRFKGDRLIQFSEKNTQSAGWINNGTYILNKNVLDNFTNSFSFENDVTKSLIKREKLGVFTVKNYNFIDIGIEQDYYKLCSIYEAKI